MERLAQQLNAAVICIPGAWVEDKRLTLSLHWRAVPFWAAGQLRRLVREVTAPYLKDGLIRETCGKRVIEFRPSVNWGKGDVIAWMRRYGDSRKETLQPLCIYFGDDRTDEEAFRAVNRHGGISVFVGSRRWLSSGRWWLRSPREVRYMLAQILHARRQTVRSA